MQGPTAVKLEGGGATVVPSIYAPAQVPTRSIAVAQTYQPPKFEGLIQPKLPLTLSGTLPSEAGPIRRQSRPACERPSPVAFDGPYKRV